MASRFDSSDFPTASTDPPGSSSRRNCRRSLRRGGSLRRRPSAGRATEDGPSEPLPHRSEDMTYLPPLRSWVQLLSDGSLNMMTQWDDSEPTSSIRARLARAGVVLPARAADEDAVGAALRALIELLAEHHIYLFNTDHLTDEALYDHLLRAIDEPDCPPGDMLEALCEMPEESWTDGVPEAVADGTIEAMGPTELHLDMSGSPFADVRAIELYLAYYAEPQVRRQVAETGPMPPRRSCIARRDGELPQPPSALISHALMHSVARTG